MSVQLTALKLSKAKQWTNENITDLANAVILLAQGLARTKLAGNSPTAITNNSGAATTGPIAVVPTASPFTYGGGATYAPRAAFNTAIATVDNAIATLATYLNTNVFTALSASDSITLNTGTVTANTVAAITASLTGTDGAVDVATDTLTLSTAAPANGDTVVVNGKTYTFQTSLTNTDGNVLIGASLTTAATNLFNAINLGTGSGTTYAAATTLHSTVSATNPSAGVVGFAAKTGGPAGNAYTLSRTFATGANATVASATFTGGAQDTAMLRSEFNAAISTARNNLSTLLKAYNQGAAYINATTIMDNSGGKADTAFALATQGTAATTVTSATVSSADCASNTAANSALAALAADLSYIAARIGANLLASGTLSAPTKVLVVQ